MTKDLRKAIEEEARECAEYAEGYGMRAQEHLQRGDYLGAQTYSQRAKESWFVAHRIKMMLEAFDAEQTT